MNAFNVSAPINLGDEIKEDFMDYAMQRGFGDLHIKFDPKTGLKAIVALHSTKFGPALGGCRFLAYPSSHDALLDALRLARGMSYKAALVNLPFGGGKSVCIRPESDFDREAYFQSFGRFINELNGQYITAVDSGTTLDDMESIHQQTPYVASLKSQNGEPSPFTALGIRYGIEAAVKHKYNRDSVEGLHIAIQGVGKVGGGLALDLHRLGAKLTIADIKSDNIKRIVEETNANVVPFEDILEVQCDVLAPCALGAAINDRSMDKLHTEIIAGAANNQLARSYHGELLHERGILYAPDYVINAGGLIYATNRYQGLPAEDVEDRVTAIYTSLLSIFERANSENLPPSVIADTMAQEKLS